VNHKSADNIIFKVAGSEIPETLYHFVVLLMLDLQAMQPIHMHALKILQFSVNLSKIKLASSANHIGGIP
jgi:hypothetical protein